ncbi:hypothetical protein HYS90_00330, partial [Candidatus Curtissbacteria bacterium]|nr:hypothetical protein [Candidatus Curtissbacteria bacterium]
MNERLKYVRQEYKITRRDLNHALVTLGGALLASEAIKVLSPANEDFGRIEEIAEETHQKLRQFNPVTVAHRGANTFDRLGQSIDAGVNFAEADVRSSLGRLVITHEEEWQLLAYDLCRRLIGLSGVVPNIEELARRTKAEKQKLFLDIKENSADLIERVVEKVYQYELQFQVSYFATTWQVLDRVGQFTGRAD